MNDLQKHSQELQEQVKHRDTVLRLQKVPAFKEIITEGFCVEACANLVKASVNSQYTESDRMMMLERAKAAGHLHNWLMGIIAAGNKAEEDLKQVINEMNNEG